MFSINGVLRNFFGKNDSIPKTEIATVKPKNLNDAEKIVDYLHDKISVVVNFEETPENEIKQMIDFITGKTFGITGDTEQIGEKIFIFTPLNVTVEIAGKKKKFWQI